MGVDVGFEFFKYKNGKLEKANIIEKDGRYWNYLNICGRCDATYIFIRLVEQFKKEGSWRDDCKPEDKYSSYLLLNHPELDGLEDHSNQNQCCQYFKKYFYLSLADFKSNFDFDEAQETHDNLLKDLNEELAEMQKELESIRVHQENAKTKAAFDGFEEKIQDIKEKIQYKKEYIKDIEEDDYGYNHYMWIKKDIEHVEKIIKSDPDIVVVAYKSY